MVMTDIYSAALSRTALLKNSCTPEFALSPFRASLTTSVSIRYTISLADQIAHERNPDPYRRSAWTPAPRPDPGDADHEAPPAESRDAPARRSDCVSRRAASVP